ncbi:MAG: alpha/beta hydrolase [Pseudomonadota bacterium]|nr:alpha/beta hydrolase [Pseudomonadota bacterium]
MDDVKPSFIEVGEGEAARPIAVLHEPGRSAGPGLVWLGGFRSDMIGTKATVLAAFARARGLAVTRFDYSGHGASGGRFEESTVSRWLEDAERVFDVVTQGPQVVVGSSMGGWIALLLARRLAERGLGDRLKALLLIAPAPDFTEALMWQAFPPEVRDTILREGVWHRPSAYGDGPYPITRALIEDGRRHLLLGRPIPVPAPVRILQGMQDPDVPWQHAMTLVERLEAPSVLLTLIKDGDHRLSRDGDLALLMDTVAALAGAA